MCEISHEALKSEKREIRLGFSSNASLTSGVNEAGRMEFSS